jgi:catechol-2,3-dioxygenase
MIIKGLELYTNKIKELKKFYTEILELKLIKEDENYFSVSCGETEFSFRKFSGSNDPFYHFAFNIPENKLGEAKEWISSKLKLIKLNGEDEFDFRSWNAHSIYFYDPSGNIVELIARHNLKNSSSGDFSGRSILSVSEFGLPVHDAEKAYNEIAREFSIPFFSGDKKTFCAAGDDSGLIIFVNEGRKWFPDCEEAEIFPATIKILSDSIKTKEFDNLPYKIISTTN